jgi:hypothetical protein
MVVLEYIWKCDYCGIVGFFFRDMLSQLAEESSGRIRPCVFIHIYLISLGSGVLAGVWSHGLGSFALTAGVRWMS